MLHEDTEMQGQPQGMTDAEFGVMKLRTKDRQLSPEAGSVKEWVSPRTFRGAEVRGPADTLTFEFQPPELGDNKCLLFWSPLVGNKFLLLLSPLVP